MHVKRIVSIFLLSVVFPAFAWAAPAYFTYQGQIIKPNGQALEANNVQFQIEILSPEPELCVLYEESHTLNMINSNGIFAVTVGEGARPGDGSFQDLNTLTNALNNFTGAVSPDDCVAGPTYTPDPSDGRKLRITFDDGSGPVTIAQDHNVVSVPYAASAASVSGITASELLRINNGTGFNLTQNNLNFVFNDANWTELQALLDGTSSSFSVGAPTADVDNNNQKIINLDDPNPSADTDAVNVRHARSYIGGRAVDTTNIGSLAGGADVGKVISWDGTQWITSVIDDTTKLPTAGGTMSGPINMGNQNITNINEITTGGNVTVGGGIGVTNGLISGGNLQVNNEMELRLLENSANGTEYVSLKSPATLGGNVNLTLPNNDGDPGQYLQTDGSGVLSWQDVNAGVTQVFGRSGNVVATAGDYDASQIDFDNTYGGDVDVATNVQAGIEELSSEKLAKSGDSMTGNLLMDLNAGVTTEIRFQDTGTRYIGFKAPNTVTAPSSFVWTLPVADGTAGQVLSTSGAGVLSWVDKEPVDYVSESRDLTAGAGLTGGGDLSANRTFDIGAGNGITVNANDIEVRAGSGISVDGSGVNVDIAGTADEATVQGTDSILIRDSSDAGNLKEMTRANFVLSQSEVGAFATSEGFLQSITGTELDNVWSGNGILVRTSPGTYSAITNNSSDWDQAFAWGDHSTAGYLTSESQSLDDAYNNGSNVDVDSSDVIFNLTSTNNFQIQDNGTSSFVVTDSGDVGIGTATPGQRFHVEGGDFQFGGTADSERALSFFRNSAQVGKLSTGNSSFTIAAANNRDIVVQDDTSTRLIVKDGGNIGIGTTNPNSRFHVEGEQTVADGGIHFLEQLELSVDPSSAGTNTSYIGRRTRVSGQGANSIIGGSISGSSIEVEHSGAGDVSGLYGSSIQVKKTGPGLSGANFGTFSAISNESTGTIGFSYNFYAMNSNSGGGTIGEAAGLYIADLSGDETYGVFQMHSSDKNYFAGNVGLGTTSPQSRLQVDGGVQIGDDLDACSATKQGTLKYVGGTVSFCDGTGWEAFGTASGGEVNTASSVGGATPIFKQKSGVDFEFRTIASANSKIGVSTVADVVTLTLDESQFNATAIPIGTTPLTATTLQAAIVELNSGKVASSTQIIAGGGLTGGGDLSTDRTLAVGAGNGINVNANDIEVTGGSAITVDGTGVNVDITNETAETSVAAGDEVLIYDASVGALRKMTRSNFVLSNAEVEAIIADDGYVIDGGNAPSGSLDVGTTNTQNLNFLTNNSTAMTIDTLGNIGIGTTVPERPLHVDGAVRIDPQALPGSPQAGDLAFDSADSNKLKFYDGSSWIDAGGSAGGSLWTDNAGDVFYNSGNVGIGTSTPNVVLDVIGESHAVFNRARTNNGNSSGAALRLTRSFDGGVGAAGIGVHQDFYVETSVEGNEQAVAQIGAAALDATSGAVDSYFYINTQNNGTAVEALRIDNLGSVGIGTTTPERLLHTDGPIRINPQALPGSPQAGDLAFDSADSNKLKFYDGSTWIEAGGSGGSGDFLADGSIPMTGALQADYGTTALPGIAFDGDEDTGFQGTGADQIWVSMGGNLSWLWGENFFRSQYVGGANIDGSLGSETDPTYSFVGDTNTGVFHPTSENLGFSTDGVERLRIDGVGNIGIGTTVPASLLDVSGTIRAEQICDEAGNNCQDISTGWTGGGGSGDFLADGSIPMTGDLTLDRRIIGGNPNNVIDTADAGGSRMTLRTSDADIHIRTINNNDIYFTTSANERMRISQNGNVGFGTTVPQSNVHIQSSTGAQLQVTGNGDLDTPSVALFETPSATTPSGFELQFDGDNGSDSLKFIGHLSGTSTTHMSIHRDSGNVGVGTTSPNEKLTLEGGMSFKEMTAPTTDVATYHKLYVDAADNKLKFRDEAGAVTDLLAGGGASSINDLNDATSNSNVLTMGDGVSSTVNSGVVLIGPSAGGSLSNGDNENTAVGSYAGFDIDSGDYNTTVGSLAIGGSGNGPQANMIGNTAVGYSTLYAQTGNYNIGIGYQAGYNSAMGSGDNNIFIGKDSGNFNFTFGSDNILIGTNTDVPFGSASNFINIGNTIYGDSSLGNVGIGTTAPERLLHVDGPIRVTPEALPGSPQAGDLAFDNADSNKLKYYDGSSWIDPAGGGGGEVNTASNVGGGQAIFKQKSAEDLEFKTLSSGSVRVSVLSNANEVSVDVNEGSIDHDNLSGFIANEHINHGSVNLTAGAGLNGGGDITSSRSFAVGAGAGINVNANDVEVNISGTTATTVRAGTDSLLIHDTSAGALRRITTSNFLSGYLQASIGTSAGDVMGADAVPHCDPDEKLEMSAGPSYFWSCVSAGGAASSLDAPDGTPTQVLSVDNDGEIVLGTGDGAIPTTTRLRGAAATGLDVPGGDLYIDASNGTGGGGSGDIIFRTAEASAAPIGVDYANISTSVTNSDSMSTSHTIPTKANGLLMVGVTIDSNDTVTTLTYNGIALTLLDARSNSSATRAEVWYMLNPPSGTHTLSLNLSGNDQVLMGAIYFYNVDQGAPFGTHSTNSGNGDPISGSVSSATDEYVFDVLASDSVASMTADGSQTELWNSSMSGLGQGAASIRAGDTTANVTWTLDGPETYAHIIVPIKPQNPGGTALPGDSNLLGERLRIDKDGNVGIGTDTPDEILTVYNGSTYGRYTTGGWTHSSDRRLKEEIQPMDSSLEKILQLKPVTYKYRTDREEKQQIGFIAQDVEPLFPEVVETDDEGLKSMIYSNLIAPVVKAIQELNRKIDKLFATQKKEAKEVDRLKRDLARQKIEHEEKVKKLESQNEQLEKRLEAIEKLIREEGQK